MIMEESRKLRIAGTISESVADGPGLRFVVFLQGCPRSCPGCHNPQTQDMNGGYEITIGEILSEIRKDPLLTGITLSGGEPFLQASALVPFLKECRALGLDVITYTGWTFEQLTAANNPDWNALIAESDIVVDGPYIQEQRSLQIKFRGSKNQRMVDVSLSLLMLSVHTQEV
ncbi:MAG: anaerobic ribonucleoside-triphosphate reductase activating protein [Planctomycetia bacterium]|nr:anaerobic ribonucleoside-triphosphate reductase activating protein [Planctomycetia bacterium]